MNILEQTNTIPGQKLNLHHRPRLRYYNLAVKELVTFSRCVKLVKNLH